MTSINSTACTRLRRLLPAAFIAVAVTLGGNAIVDPAVASAAPMKYDFLRYLTCANYWGKKYTEGAITEKEYESARKACCASSGGDYEGSGSAATCKEPPPANAPGGTVQPGTITQTWTPTPATAPHGSITQTFTPVP